MRFKATIWSSGTSKVLTIPAKLEPEIGQEFWVTLEEVNDGEGTD